VLKKSLKNIEDDIGPFINTIQSVAKFFRSSPQRIDLLKSTAEKINVKFLMPVRTADTRWSYLSKAIKTTNSMYLCYLLTLYSIKTNATDTETASKALLLFQSLHSVKFFFIISFLNDILPSFDKVVVSFQHSIIDYSSSIELLQQFRKYIMDLRLSLNDDVNSWSKSSLLPTVKFNFSNINQIENKLYDLIKEQTNVAEELGRQRSEDYQMVKILLIEQWLS